MRELKKELIVEVVKWERVSEMCERKRGRKEERKRGRRERGEEGKEYETEGKEKSGSGKKAIKKKVIHV